MTRNDVLALAARVEAATGADRELGTRVIAAALAPANAFVEQSKINGAWCIYTADADGKNRSWQRPRAVRGDDQCPTANLDAAMSLVPGGATYASVERLRIGTPDEAARAEVSWLADDGDEIRHGSHAATPALALTAASLRAIAGSMTDD